jgi:hypothetical protein
MTKGRRKRARRNRVACARQKAFNRFKRETRLGKTPGPTPLKPAIT